MKFELKFATLLTLACGLVWVGEMVLLYAESAHGYTLLEGTRVFPLRDYDVMVSAILTAAMAMVTCSLSSAGSNE